MKKLATSFMAASVISLVVSFTGPGSEFLWGFLKPLSAILFGAFFITNLLAKEYADYDEEHEYRMELARKQKSERTTGDDDGPATRATVSGPPIREREFVEAERSASEEREAVSRRDRR